MDCARARTQLFQVALLFSFSSLFASGSKLNVSIPNYSEIYKPLDYAVVGQQKSGTSTLWNVLTSNPAIKWVGYGKESFFFSPEGTRTAMCDNLVEEFQVQVAVQRLRFNRTDISIGDWSATHFSCPCCPVALKTLNPKLKIIVVLRDPVQRALSRFVEQKRNPKMPFHVQVKNYTFAEFASVESAALEACLARAAPLRQPSTEAASAQPLAGWGAGLDMARWMEMQCYTRSNIIGWSVYDVFLENYLAHFPKDQVLVMYTDNLSSQPLQSYKLAEAFLGAPSHQYDKNIINLVFNSHDCYHWRCARKRGEVRSPSEDASVSAAAGSPRVGAADVPGHDGAGAQNPQRDAPFNQAMSRLEALYRPHVQRLFDWADQGLIAQPPHRWRQLYAT